jgi:hypothetical protein
MDQAHQHRIGTDLKQGLMFNYEISYHQLSFSVFVFR